MKKTKQAASCMRKTSIGGQALMEGIMMRGPKKSAMAVRNTKGEIVVEEFPTQGAKRPAICRWPIIRGLFGYFDSMAVGYKCLMRSAELSGLEDLVEESPKKKKKREEAEKAAAAATAEASAVEASEASELTVTPEAPVSEPLQSEPAEEKKDGQKEEKMPAWVMTLITVVSMVLAVGLAFVLFMYLPSFLYELLERNVPFLQTENAMLNSLLKSTFEGLLKILLLVGYMSLITLMKDIRRTFMYHGAEHKTIFCYESGLDLTVENVRLQRRFHPRCGTSFLILMLLVSIFVSFFIDPISIAVSGDVMWTPLRVLTKIVLLPLIVGLGYELIKFAGRHDNWLTRFISLPGVWLQHVTVLEPTDDMIECAIEAMKRAIPDDESDQW